MKGSELKEMIYHSGIAIDEIVSRSGVPKRTLYNLFNRSGEIKGSYIKQLSDAGIINSTKTAMPLSANMGESAELIKIAILALRESVQALRGDNDSFKEVRVFLQDELRSANQLIAEHVRKTTVMNEDQFLDHINSLSKSKNRLKKRDKSN